MRLTPLIARLEAVASEIAPPFGEVETMILAAIDLADDTLGDADIEDHPTLGEHDGREPADDQEPWLGRANPGGHGPMPEGWSLADMGEWTLNCEMLRFDGSGRRIARRLL